MWTPPDPDALPTQNEMDYIRGAIQDLETAVQDNLEIIEQAKLRIITLEKEIGVRRAWLAPIRKLPVEVLAEIFVHCSSHSALAPVTITEVCHLWRQVVLATPQAWCFIYFGYYRKRTDESRYLPTFFERSKSCLVHLLFSNPFPLSPLTLITPHLDRISCLSIPSFDLERISDLVFPNLTRLEITGFSEDGLLLNKAHFPSLLHLDSRECALNPGPIDTVYPPLQFLALFADSNREWVQVVKSCSSSLRSLIARGSFQSDDAKSMITLTFPMLTYLALEEDWVIYSKVPSPLLHVVTPRLVSYEQTAAVYPPWSFDLHGDVKRVLHLLTDHIFELANYSSLRSLQLQVSWYRGETFTSKLDKLMKDLRKDPSVCPALESIEIFPSDYPQFRDRMEWETLMPKIKETIQTPRPWIKLSIVEKPSSTPASSVRINCKHAFP